jgi:hypothetical protein
VKRIPAVAFLILGFAVVPGFADDPRDDLRDDLYHELSASLDQAEALVAGLVLEDEAPITEEQLQVLKSLNRQIRGSLYSDLIDRSDQLLLLTQEQMLVHQNPQQLQGRMEEILRGSRQDARDRELEATREKVLRASLQVTFLSFTSAFTFWGLGELQDRRYFQATSVEEATLRRRLFQIFSIGSMVGAAVGVIGAGVSATLYAGHTGTH